MAAHVDHTFKKGFLLDEESLRKIANILNQRLIRSDAPNSPIQVSYRVTRADAYAYDTTSVEDIINEDNNEWKRITALKIFTAADAPTTFDLSFSPDESKFAIVGNSRDTVYLLSSDLKEYMTNEVCICRILSKKTFRFIGLLLAVLALVFFSFLTFRQMPYKDIGPTPAQVSDALKASDLSTKLNFIISLSDRPRVPPTNDLLRYTLSLFPLLFLFVFYYEELFNFVSRFFFPANQFLFGRQKEKYESRIRLRSNILWGVGIAFAVGLVASLAAWRLTK